MTPYDDIELFGLVETGAETPIADDETLGRLGAAVAETLLDGLQEAGLVRLAPTLGWSLVNILHREIERLGRRADEGAGSIRELADAQDGSEVRDVELQEAMAAQARLDEMREALGAVREAAAEAYAQATGEPWLPRSGSRTGRAVTAAQIEARDRLAARTRAQAEALDPKGAKIVVSGPVRFTDAGRVFAALDRVRERVPDMVLVTKGAAGVELIARRWAAIRGIAQITVRPDWTKTGRAPFAAIDDLLALRPAGVVLIESEAERHTGVPLNLGQKAEARRIKVWRVGTPKEVAPAALQPEAGRAARRERGGARAA